MTPTIATIAVCAAAEILPAPIAARVIDTISTRMECQLSRVVAESRRLKANLDAEIAAIPPGLKWAMSLRDSQPKVANETNEQRRMRLFDMGGPIASLASTMTVAEFEEIARQDPHMRRG